MLKHAFDYVIGRRKQRFCMYRGCVLIRSDGSDGTQSVWRVIEDSWDGQMSSLGSFRSLRAAKQSIDEQLHVLRRDLGQRMQRLAEAEKSEND